MSLGVSYDYAALRYLDQWCEREAAYWSDLKSRSREDRRSALRQAAAFFRIARTLPTKGESGLQRYDPILDALENLPSARTVTTTAVDGVVAAFATSIGAHYQQGVISAASKILWLWYRDPVVIYDERARNALGATPWDYAAYRRLWEAKYASAADEIQDACLRLPRMRNYAAVTLSSKEVRALASESWFQRRVFDIKLWKDGGPGSAGSPSRLASDVPTRGARRQTG